MREDLRACTDAIRAMTGDGMVPTNGMHTSAENYLRYWVLPAIDAALARLERREDLKACAKALAWAEEQSARHDGFVRRAGGGIVKPNAYDECATHIRHIAAALRPPARGDARADWDKMLDESLNKRYALRARVARLESALEPLQSLTPTDMVPVSGCHMSLANYARYWLVPLLTTKHPEGGAGCESSSSTLPSKPELPT